MRPLFWITAITVCAAASHLAADEIGTGWWQGRPITYRLVHGLAIVEGDVQLGTPGELSVPSAGLPENRAKSDRREASFVADPAYRWPGGVVPYVIGSDVTALQRQRIQESIDAFTAGTPIRWTPRTNQANYVQFITLPPDVYECGDSSIGMKGGVQSIRLSTRASCADTFAHVAHEMAHAIGKEHEQVRFDRDFYIKVRYDNIDKLYFDAYDPVLGNTPGRARAFDVLSYDYGSNMHYADTLFKKSANTNTIDTIPLGIPIIEGAGFSANDLESMRRAYGAPPASDTTITTFPPGLQIVVDGVAFTAPQTFPWADGSRHTVGVPTEPQANASTPTVLRYVFGRWSNSGPQSQTLTAAPENRILAANFIAQYRIQAVVSSAGGGTVSISPSSPDGFYAQGTRIAITPAPAQGFQFLRWDTPSGSVRSSQAADSDNPAQFTVTRDYAFRANFVSASTPVTMIASSVPAGGLVTPTAVIDGTSRLLPSAFAWTPGSSHTLNIADPIQPSGASGVSARYAFQGWSMGASPSQTITAGATSSTVTANWKKQFLVTARTFDPGAGLNSSNGKVTITPSATDCPSETSRATGCYYDEGATVQAAAATANGYSFTGWSGDLTGDSPAGQLIVSDQIVIQANFAVAGRLYRYGIFNAANYGVTPLAPGEIFSIFGYKLGPASAVQTGPVNGVFPTVAANTRVLFDGVAAPLIYASGSQISGVVPYAVANKSTTAVQIEVNGVRGNSVTVPVGAADPALFTVGSVGSGQGALLNQDGSVNGAGSPAAPGSVIVLFGTGEGATTPAGKDGKLATDPYPKPTQPVSVIIAGRPARVAYYGAAPGLIAGLLQVNAFVPDDCPTGNVPVSISVGDTTSPASVTVAVK